MLASCYNTSLTVIFRDYVANWYQNVSILHFTGAKDEQSSIQIVTIKKPSSSFLQVECLSCYPTDSVRALKEKSITLHGLAHPKLTLSLTTKGYLKEDCQASHQPSDTSTASCYSAA